MITLTQQVSELILNADAKALGTMSQNSLHVIPVSSVKIIDNKIILVNYFLGQTVENIKLNPKVVLTCWGPLEGYQIKGTIEHQTEGEIFNTIKDWVTETLPNRVVKGVLVFSSEEVFDVSLDPNLI